MSRSILHLSDVHFGSEHARGRATTLLAVIDRIRPDVVAVSGDLTQRARSREFLEARAFLDRIGPPHVVVPGNHDVPLWNVAKRLASPLAKWRRYMRVEPTSSYADDRLVVLGIDTTRRFGVKGGRVDAGDVEGVSARLVDAAPGACRVVVGHHPLATPGRSGAGDRALGGRAALAAFEALGVEVLLSGHLHETHAFRPVDAVTGTMSRVLLVNAGTATSNRGRRTEAHANSFNVITVLARAIRVTTYLHTAEGTTYVARPPRTFRRLRVSRAARDEAPRAGSSRPSSGRLRRDPPSDRTGVPRRMRRAGDDGGPS